MIYLITPNRIRSLDNIKSMVPYYLHVHVYLFNSAIVQSNTILLAFLCYFNFGRISELRLCPNSTLH